MLSHSVAHSIAVLWYSHKTAILGLFDSAGTQSESISLFFQILLKLFLLNDLPQTWEIEAPQQPIFQLFSNGPFFTLQVSANWVVVSNRAREIPLFFTKQDYNNPV